MRETLADRLFSYILPGKAPHPGPGLEQAREAERIGLDGIFLSERWETKELGAVMGALTQATSRITLVAGLTHFGTRHPLVQAGMAQTLQALSGNRFVLGYGRGVPSQFRQMGIPVPNLQGMADHVDILRRLWAGETVTYSGPAGEYPEMALPIGTDAPPPVLIGTIGPKTLALAGRHFDGVVLHPFLTADGVRRSVELVRGAAADAGRDPLAVKFYATVVTAPDFLSDAQRADILEARAVSYFMHREVGLPIVTTNGWTEAPLDALAATGLAKLEYGAGNMAETRRLMAEAVSLLPPEWLASGAATGSVDQCAARLNEYIDAGADYILLHGTTPDQQGPLVERLRTLPLKETTHA
ncbi:MAG: TIGR03857 family LLM class F420-dependent oxidoreductase [Pseudomonadota bacterium]